MALTALRIHHLHALGGAGLLLATLYLVAILFPAASSPLVVAGLSRTAPASSSPSPLVITGLSTTDSDASASPSSPPVVATLTLSTCASASPAAAEARGLSPTASACASASSPPPTTVRDAAPVRPSATPASAPSSPRTRSAAIRHARGSATCASGSSAGNATVGSAITTVFDAEGQRARSESVTVRSIRRRRSASPSPPVVTRFSPTACACFSSPSVAALSPTVPSSPLTRSAAIIRHPPNSSACDTSSAGNTTTVGSVMATTTTPTSTSSSSSPGRFILILSMVAALLAAAGGWMARAEPGAEHDDCQVCFMNKPVFLLRCCNKRVCNFCIRDFVRDTHGETCEGLGAGKILPLLHPHEFQIGGDVPADYENLPRYPPWYFCKSMKKNLRIHLFYYHLHELEEGGEPRVTEVIHHAFPGGNLSAAILCDVQPTIRPFSEL